MVDLSTDCTRDGMLLFNLCFDPWFLSISIGLWLIIFFFVRANILTVLSDPKLRMAMAEYLMIAFNKMDCFSDSLLFRSDPDLSLYFSQMQLLPYCIASSHVNLLTSSWTKWCVICNFIQFFTIFFFPIVTLSSHSEFVSFSRTLNFASKYSLSTSFFKWFFFLQFVA